MMVSFLARYIYGLVKLDLRDTYPNSFMLVSEVLATFLTLMIYHYTSQAFVPKVSSSLLKLGGDYFSYLVIGDLFLKLPQTLFYNTTRKFRQALMNGAFENMYLFGRTPAQICRTFSLMGIPREIMGAALTLIVAILFFDLQISWRGFSIALGLQVLGLGAFLGLGMYGCSLILFLGKGEGMIQYLSTLGMILAGIYFPIDVLPEFFANNALYLSPFGTLLISTREILSGVYRTETLVQCIGLLSMWSLLLYFSGRLVLNNIQRINIRKGQSPLTTY